MDKKDILKMEQYLCYTKNCSVMQFDNKKDMEFWRKKLNNTASRFVRVVKYTQFELFFDE